jgi:hypothetical protein
MLAWCYTPKGNEYGGVSTGDGNMELQGILFTYIIISYDLFMRNSSVLAIAIVDHRVCECY